LSVRVRKPKSGPPIELTYVDAHVIQDRLDQVLGPERWEFSLMPWGSDLIGMLTITLPDLTKVSKQDAAGRSTEGDAVDIPKGAVSHVLRRCAAQFGIGRYLYFKPGEDRETRFPALTSAPPDKAPPPAYKTPTRVPTPAPAPIAAELPAPARKPAAARPAAKAAASPLLASHTNGYVEPKAVPPIPAPAPAAAPTPPSAAAPEPAPAKQPVERPKTGLQLAAYVADQEIAPLLKPWIIDRFKHRNYPGRLTDWTEDMVSVAWPDIRDHLRKIQLTAQMTAGTPTAAKPATVLPVAAINGSR